MDGIRFTRARIALTLKDSRSRRMKNRLALGQGVEEDRRNGDDLDDRQASNQVWRGVGGRWQNTATLHRAGAAIAVLALRRSGFGLLMLFAAVASLLRRRRALGEVTGRQRHSRRETQRKCENESADQHLMGFIVARKVSPFYVVSNGSVIDSN